ncbi:MAG: hypothetical protein KKF02_11030, partial [Proteobacteria bacterium]|nr:hypothetical protein [Pseudomonadota bacterium]
APSLRLLRLFTRASIFPQFAAFPDADFVEGKGGQLCADYSDMFQKDKDFFRSGRPGFDLTFRTGAVRMANRKTCKGDKNARIRTGQAC